MIISKYGINLIRLTEEYLELVRNWRNADEVRRYMNFQEYITPEMQLKWFNSINNAENFYYLIEYKGDKIGLLNDKNINWKEKTSEGGLFIWDQRFINSMVPLMVSFLALEVAYFVLGWNKTYIKVRKDNHRAIEYNKAFGYVESTESLENEFIQMILTKESFFNKADKLRRMLNQVSGNEKIILTFEPNDEISGTRTSVEEIINAVPYEVLKCMVDVRRA